MQVTIPISKNNYFKAYIRSISPILNIGKAAEKVLVGMFENNIDLLTKDARKNLINYLNTNKFVVNNYISALKKKGILVKTAGGLLQINPTFIKNIKTGEIHIHFKVD